jgi:hypothetical protein
MKVEAVKDLFIKADREGGYCLFLCRNSVVKF